MTIDIYVCPTCIRLLTYTFGGKKAVGGDVNKHILIDRL